MIELDWDIQIYFDENSYRSFDLILYDFRFLLRFFGENISQTSNLNYYFRNIILP